MYSILALYLTFTGMGLAVAAVLYEPAYATVNAYFDAERQNALLAHHHWPAWPPRSS